MSEYENGKLVHPPGTQERLKALAELVQREAPDRHVFRTENAVYMVSEDGLRGIMLYSVTLTGQIAYCVSQAGTAPSLPLADLLSKAVA